MKGTLVTTVVVILITAALVILVIGKSGRNKTEQNRAILPAGNETSEPATEEPLSSSSGQIIFYYGNTCPHCAEVEDWMNENKVEEKLNIVKKEVYTNQNNSSELISRAQKCGLDTNSLGVPFLYTQEGKCLMGTPDVINYLSEKIGKIAPSPSLPD